MFRPEQQFDQKIALSPSRTSSIFKQHQPLRRSNTSMFLHTFLSTCKCLFDFPDIFKANLAAKSSKVDSTGQTDCEEMRRCSALGRRLAEIQRSGIYSSTANHEYSHDIQQKTWLSASLSMLIQS